MHVNTLDTISHHLFDIFHDCLKKSIELLHPRICCIVSVLMFWMQSSFWTIQQHGAAQRLNRIIVYFSLEREDMILCTIVASTVWWLVHRNKE